VNNRKKLSGYGIKSSLNAPQEMLGIKGAFSAFKIKICTNFFAKATFIWQHIYPIETFLSYHFQFVKDIMKEKGWSEYYSENIF